MSQLNKDLLPILIWDGVLSKMYNYYDGKSPNNHAYAVSVYMFLYKSARIQGNIRVLAKDVFIKKGVGISSAKLAQVKRDLTQMKLIKTIRPREKNGQYSTESYIEVKYVWHPEKIDKLAYQESDETLKYKIAKKLLLNLYPNLEPIYPQNEGGFDFEIDIEIHGEKEVVYANYFYFENNLLKASTAFSQGGEFDFTIPTDKVSELILYLASQEQYSFDSVNEILQMTSSN